VASVIACAGVTTAVVINMTESLWIGVAAGLLLGVASGLVNGVTGLQEHTARDFNTLRVHPAKFIA
jgi:predicted ABC-type sugar transport system permease subunit